MADRFATIDMGGELGETLSKLEGKEFDCDCAWRKNRESSVSTLMAFECYPHDGGLADDEGHKWWLYWTCPICGYQWSWHKIENRLERQNVQNQM